MSNFIIDQVNNFNIELKNRNYSNNTIKIYLNTIKQFLSYSIKQKYNPSDRIKYFLNSIKSNEVKRLSYQAIKTFYTYVVKKPCPYLLNKIKNKKRVITVLTKKEILQILELIINKKHKTMISMLYGSGLRVSEVVNLKIKDIDFEKNKLIIRNSKCKKDRITLLSSLLIKDLKELINNRKLNEYLFTTIYSKKYCIRTVQQIFKKALILSKINKNATCHSLRHSFATHLLESSIDIRIIKNLLGHKSIKTTMIYLNTIEKLNLNIPSPL